MLLIKKYLKFALNYAPAVGQVCLNCSIMSLHCVQQFACLRGMNIHVVSRDKRQITHW